MSSDTQTAKLRWISPPDDPVYPSSDGRPMAENTRQFQWIVTLKEGLEALYRNDPDVFVAGDLLWYPVEGQAKIRVAPDAMVVFGRPKGHRGSYIQFRENGVAPQVVFEVLSPGNTPVEMERKRQFYERHGVEEYYEYDPDNVVFRGWIRRNGRLQEVGDCNDWRSPRLGIRFEIDEELKIYTPEGERFVTFLEQIERTKQALQERETALRGQAEAERQWAEAERQWAEAERQWAEAERQTAEADRRAERLAEKLRELGIDPDES